MTEERKRVILRFQVGVSAYAVPIEIVQEVVRHHELTRVPSMPAAVYGLMNVRGHVVPVIDLMRRFRLGDSDTPLETWAIVFRMQDEGRTSLMAVPASSAEVVTILESDVHSAPAFGADIDVEYLAGMVHIGDDLVLLLNVDRVLSTEDLLRTREGIARQDHLVAEARTPGRSGERKAVA